MIFSSLKIIILTISDSNFLKFCEMEDSKIENLVQAWSEMYMGEVLEFAKPKDVSNEEVFGDVYHSLIHSSVAETLVRLEHSNAQVKIANHWIRRCSQM